MTKAEIVREVSKSTGIEATTVSAVVEGFMEAVKSSLAKDNNVYLRGFGTFAVQTGIFIIFSSSDILIAVTI